MPGAYGRFHASVSHDRRFTLAVAGGMPIGVDIEAVSTKIVRAGHLFMNEDERKIVSCSMQDLPGAATRIWTAKEAAAKALNLHLVDAWHDIRLAAMGTSESSFLYGPLHLTAVHLESWGRIISLVSMPAES